jgi:hypothetical protein
MVDFTGSKLQELQRHCHGKLYALSEGEELFSHELLVDAGGGRVVEHVINERASPVYDKCYPYERYLVASCDKLFLVRWWYPFGRFRRTRSRCRCLRQT